MSDIIRFLYPFWIFVDHMRELPSLGIFWAVMVALCGCGVSYLLHMALSRRHRHD